MFNSIIYALTDPRTGRIRYIGKSAHGIKRAKRHRTPRELKGHTHKARWINSLHKIGMTYGVKILEKCTSELELNKSERQWIKIGKRKKWPLTNLTEGGDGQSPGHHTPKSVRLKISLALKGKSTSKETRQRLSDAARAAWQRPDVRKKQVAALHSSFQYRTHPTPTTKARAIMSSASRLAWRINRKKRLAMLRQAVIRAAEIRAQTLIDDPTLAQKRAEHRRIWKRDWMRRQPIEKKRQWRHQHTIELAKQIAGS